MKILVTGASGLVGSALVPYLTSKGHEVVRLVRSRPKSGTAEIEWNPESGVADPSRLEGFDAVVHLAGENISEGRWTDEKKRRIRESRVKGTRVLAENLAQLAQPPRTLASASAIGFYGNRGDELLNEQSASGQDFLAEVCREWELATRPAAERGIRVANLRFGVILSREGGALAKMLTPFKLGVGGRVGSGRQYMSWITLDDTVGSIYHALTHEDVRGPVNVVAPRPVTNEEFTKTLGQVLSRPTLLPAPAFALRLAFGEMADALLLSSARVEPARLKETGYTFQHPELEGALKSLL
ncbi:MAG TPA: TIGR01777 family oxidoreductase [Pyrinomonadaceae bacterium]